MLQHAPANAATEAAHGVAGEAPPTTRRRVPATLLAGSVAAGWLALAVVVAALAVSVAGRLLGLPAAWATPLAPLALVLLAFTALPALAVPPAGWRSLPAATLSAFAIATLCLGLLGASARIGGVEQGLAFPQAVRFAVAAGFAALALAVAAASGVRALAGTLLGVAAALLPLPALPLAAGAAAFVAGLLLRLPVAIALLAAVAVSPGPLADPALAQTFVRGLSPYPLLAVPLFILSAALMVEAGIGERIVVAARRFARGRRSALGEANIIASALFGGVSGSSIADAAMNARLLVPAMIGAGYRPGAAVGITAAGSVLPNVLPPSIALLLASGAVDQSVDALWLGGLGAGLVLSVALWLAVRLMPPPAGAAAAPAPPPPSLRVALAGLAAPAAIGLGILGALRFGLVTPVEAGLVAVLLAALFVLPRGVRPLGAAFADAAAQTGRVALLIAAAAPLGYLFAISGVRADALLPDAPGFALVAALVAALVVGTALDAGAAILVFLPVVVPALVAAGGDPVHVTVTLTVALLLGGLTPPVAILTVVVEDVSGVKGSFIGVLPYFTALLFGLCIVAAVPAITSGLVALF